MSRRPKTNRVPRTRAGGEWTEAAFWSFVRDNLRMVSRKWPPIQRAKLLRRRPYTGPNRKRKWEYRCDSCGQWFADKEVQVDHIVPAGQLRSFDDVGPWMRRLLVEVDGLQVLCKENCHHAKTHGSKE